MLSAIIGPADYNESQTMAAILNLTDSARLRYTTGALMYFAQGIPAGLLSIAIPAWLASQGVGAGEIATFLAVIILPWAFKLVTGPFMDRYMFLPMGQRRPWVLGAQLGLSISLLALMLVENPAEQIGLLMLIGVLINSFAATQDVAVDGMSIDLTPVREQGRLNAFMSFGKAAGWSATAAVTGWLLVAFGMQVTAIVASAVAGAIFIMFVFVLEREGERRLPWSRGEARSSRRGDGTFKGVFSGINQVLWTRASIVVLLIMFFDGLISGYGHALMPIAAVNVFGYTTTQWSQLVAVMGLVGAAVALGMGPMIDRFGSKRMLIVNLTLVGVHAFLLAQTQYMWEDSLYVRTMLSFWVMMNPVVMVCGIALAMAICSSSASATQFAIYMSTANLGYSAGSKLFGMLAEHTDYVEIYTLLSALVLTTVLVLMFHRYGHEPERTQKRVRRYTIGTGGAEAGMFFSGAIRCPKCRADMEVVEHEGVEIDRCKSCGGIWFDAGEVELLRNKAAAAAIDTGQASEGKRYNVIDEYRCPRCGGDMEKHTDEKQRHIWYESCKDCQGSFFDAGEFRDLAELTVSDFFKRLVAPKRE
jgi:PAT family beta-lactamase induction signal transducer AmpG